MMMRPTVVAVAMSAASVAVECGGWNGRFSENWPEVLIYCAVAALYSVLTVVPCIWAGLIVRDLAVSGIALALYALLGTGLVIGVLSAIKGVAPTARDVGPFVTLNVGTVGAMFIPLRVLRACGFVLRRAGSAGR